MFWNPDIFWQNAQTFGLNLTISPPPFQNIAAFGGSFFFFFQKHPFYELQPLCFGYHMANVC
jgi:hypothetical protein